MPIGTNRRLLSYLTVIFTFITTFSAFSQDEGLKIKTVVIDAGHGGHDPGAISSDKKLKEKTVTLDIALTLGAKITAAYPGIKVIYTRDKDVYVPLDRRSDIANKNHADLFISIHCNSVGKGKAAPSGCETFVMGANKSQSNMEACKIENSVILLEEDYSTKYQGFDPNDSESFIFFNLMQNAYLEQSIIMADLCQKHLGKGPITKNRGIKQGGLLVLWRTTMPSVLVELGFITNQSDRNVLATKAKRDQLAGRLFAAFKEFKAQYDSDVEDAIETVEGNVETNKDKQVSESKKTADTVKKEGSGTVKKESTNTSKDETTIYTIQLFSLSKKLPLNSKEFKGESVFMAQYGKVYKYFTGKFKTSEEAKNALPALRKKFNDAFVTKVKNNDIVTSK